jgi:hypothetical protein
MPSQPDKKKWTAYASVGLMFPSSILVGFVNLFTVTRSDDKKK